jgi:hypothetical protein
MLTYLEVDVQRQLRGGGVKRTCRTYISPVVSYAMR